MKRRFATLLVSAATVLAPAAICRPEAGYTEKTTVQGKVPVDLRGVWLLVAHLRVSQGKPREDGTRDWKYKTLAELVTASGEGGSGTQLHLRDVRLPKEVAEGIKVGNDRLTPWSPSTAQLDGLARTWSKLRPATDKDVRAGDVDYAQVSFTIATAERYAEVFPKQDAALSDVLAKSAFSLSVEEKYRALPIPPRSNISQLMLRKSVYAVQNASAAKLEGPQLTGLLAPGAVGPIPFNFGGRFTMYRLASSGGPSRKPSAPRSSLPPTHASRRASH